RSDGTVSGRTRAALERAQATGVDVVLVSARPPHWLRDIAADLGLHGHAICCNGAVVWDPAAQRAHCSYELAPATADRLVRALREAAPGVAFSCERHGVAIREPAYVPLWQTPDEHPRTDALEI